MIEPGSFDNRRLPHDGFRAVGALAAVELDAEEEVVVDDAALLLETHAASAFHHRAARAGLAAARDPVGPRGEQRAHRRFLVVLVARGLTESADRFAAQLLGGTEDEARGARV